MTPTKYNLTVYRGRDYAITFEFREKDGSIIPIDTWQFKSEMREEECPESALLATFLIETDIPNATVTLRLTDQETLAIPEGKAFWDLLVTIGDIDESYICGKVKINCCVTEV